MSWGTQLAKALGLPSANTNRADIFNDKSLPQFENAINKGTELIKKKIADAQSPFTGVLPHELTHHFKPLDLDQPLSSLDQVLCELEKLYLNDAVYFHHPKYMAHLNAPVTNTAIMAELIQAAVNTSMDTWDQSAGGTFIEQTLIDWTLERIGFAIEDNQGVRGDGIFTSGGTQSNLMAMLLARDNYCLIHLNGHSIQENGLPPEASRFRIFTSKISHFSIQKSAALLGLGFNSVIGVDVDADFRMSPQKLQQAINDAKARGEIPIAVVATMGTTDFGSLDPITDIAAICQAHDIWLHADAAYGCGLLVSQKYRDQIKDIALADSVTVDYHKSFLQPIACGAFFAKDSTHMGCLTYHADYLNPLSQKLEGTPNLVCKSIQTTRRFDALKLWLTFRTIGPDAVGEAFDTVIDLTNAAYQAHRHDDEIEFMHSPFLSTLVFRYRPHQLDDEYLLDDINTGIRKALSRNGQALIASTKVNGALYLKFTLLNPVIQLKDIEEVIGLIKHYGHEQVKSLHDTMDTSSGLVTETA